MAVDPLLHLLARFVEEGVAYVLVGGQAVRLNGFVRATEDVDVLVADELLIDILFAANGETYETVRPHVRCIEVEGVVIRVLDIDGLIKTKTDYREKDILDKRMLERIRRALVPD
jgi:hypothetical protein